jgi:hypothetical protein
MRQAAAAFQFGGAEIAFTDFFTFIVIRLNPEFLSNSLVSSSTLASQSMFFLVVAAHQNQLHLVETAALA